MSIVCVVPTVRSAQMEEFRKAWAPLFKKHKVTLITVWDGEHPTISVNSGEPLKWDHYSEYKDLVYRHTDAVRNLGFIFASATCHNDFKFLLTLDDDVLPLQGSDPIQEHLDVLNRRVPISWMNTVPDFHAWHFTGQPRERSLSKPTEPGGTLFMRGFPYGIRDEAPVMVSHGVWVNVPDFDGRTQLKLTSNGTRPQDLPYSLPYFRGPIPKGSYWPCCGMNLMVRREALPYLYFAPMGPDSGYPNLHRFSDIWMGLLLKRTCDSLGWAIYSGASTVIHSRASDPHKNVEQEKLGIEWNERMWQYFGEFYDEVTALDFERYYDSWISKATRFEKLIKDLQQ